MRDKKKKLLLIIVIISLSFMLIGNNYFHKPIDSVELHKMLEDINLTCNSILDNPIAQEEKYINLLKAEKDLFTKGKYASVLVLINSAKGDADGIIKYGKIAVENYLKIPGGELFAISENKYIAWSMMRIGRYSDSFIAANQLLELINNDKNNILTEKDILNTEALVYSIYLSMYSEFNIKDKAKLYYDKLVSLPMTDDLRISQGDKIYYSLMQYAYSIDDYNLTAKYAKESYDLQLEIDELKGSSFAKPLTVNLGVTNILLGNLDLGLEQIKIAEEALNSMNDEFSLSSVYDGYFKYYDAKKDSETAFTYLKKRIDIFKKHNDMLRYNECLNIAIEYINKNNINTDIVPYYKEFYNSEIYLRDNDKVSDLLSTSLTINDELNKSKMHAIEKTALLSKKSNLILVVSVLALLILLTRLLKLYRIKKENENKLNELIKYDYLTKTYSRSYGYNKLHSLANNNTQFSLAIIDIDNFKSINDTFGHAVGDDVLQALSNIFIKNLSNGDFILRAGGEEFIIAFVNKDISTSLDLLNKYKEMFSSVTLPNNSTLTFSGGIVTNGSEDLDTLINNADKLLYSAKNAGKNQIHI